MCRRQSATPTARPAAAHKASASATRPASSVTHSTPSPTHAKVSTHLLIELSYCDTSVSVCSVRVIRPYTALTRPTQPFILSGSINE